MAWKFSLCLLLFLVSLICPSTCTCKDNKLSPNVTSYNGTVATDHILCSNIGIEVLKQRGHAVDAAVAAALCLGVVSPASSGLGGGAFMIIRLANGSAKAYDMRETAPAHASKNQRFVHFQNIPEVKFNLQNITRVEFNLYDVFEVKINIGNILESMYNGNGTLKAKGPLSIAVPGELAGLRLAWKHYGKLSWNKLVKPAINLARNGFHISPYLHLQMNKTSSDIMADEGLRSIFTKQGKLLESGDICYNKKLAETLEIISQEHGVKEFYGGRLGEMLVRDVQKAGGILTIDDLKNYKVKVSEPIDVEVMGVRVLSMGPPSTGGASLALMLNILEGYSNFSDINLLSHREIEALKHVFAVRMNLGDPSFANVTDVLSDMLSKRFAEELRKTISDTKTFDPSHYGGRWNQIHDHGTSHISIVDKDRNAVSMTTSINGYFGSTFLSTQTGIVLNNEMDDFSMPVNVTKDGSLPPPPNNYISPGKRPLSSMTPTILVNKTNGKLKSVVGGSGGSNIIAAVAEVLVNYLKRQMDPLNCVLAPRLFHPLIPNVVMYENWTVPTGQHFEVSQGILKALAKRNHSLQISPSVTMCQFIVQECKGNKLIAVSDPRKGGFPAGF